MLVNTHVWTDVLPVLFHYQILTDCYVFRMDLNFHRTKLSWIVDFAFLFLVMLASILYCIYALCICNRNRCSEAMPRDSSCTAMSVLHLSVWHMCPSLLDRSCFLGTR